MPRAPIDLLRTFAEGVDFRTGEPLPAGHVLRDPESIQALQWALEQLLTRTHEPEDPRLKLSHRGEAWSHEEDELLRSSFAQSLPLAQIAKAYGRNDGAISSRLKRLGLIS